MKVPQSGRVLRRAPGDHRPFVKRFWYTDLPDAPPFLAAFWNAHHSTTGKEARPLFGRLIEDIGVDLLILNEVKPRHGIPDLLKDDFRFSVRWTAPEYSIAWNRKRFGHVRDRALVMSEHDYWLERNEALAVVLDDFHADSLLKVISQHPPAHISRRSHPTFDNVLEVHKDIANRNRQIARRSQMPVLTGRDSNIDPVKDRPVIRGSWDWAYRGLDYHRAPRSTFGRWPNGRRIDELLSRGLSDTPLKEKNREA